MILPIFLSFYIKRPDVEQVNKFNEYILSKYTEKKIVSLLEQLNKEFNIPNEIISKFWVRAYTAETNFYKDMNKDLRLDKTDNYLPFIHMMYEGIKIKSLTFSPSKPLYRGAYFDEKEISLIESKTKYKKIMKFPPLLIYSKSFLSFSMNFEVAKKFVKNTILIIEEFCEGTNYNSYGCAAVKKFSFFKGEEEILIFPFSCFEVKQIKKVENKNYYIIYLSYLGKYKNLFFKKPEELVEDIPENSFLVQNLFNIDIIDEKYKNIFFKKFKKIIL